MCLTYMVVAATANYVFYYSCMEFQHLLTKHLFEFTWLKNLMKDNHQLSHEWDAMHVHTALVSIITGCVTVTKNDLIYVHIFPGMGLDNF